ncbi:phosphotransferase family protein [Spongiibacter taiwanensis]|uniref:phosphotransferase family protein n=1 Tax=Spongiibacter taiwanensis TaxID=1748242 RepID=UPI002036399A|nr:phosphotransferase family protein [Spongiibacter taiwanensis]USA42575.1 phosphotransferase family protein [Spongiibacter taiwanensis]
MRINRNDHYLSLALAALDEHIAPELTSTAAQSTLEILKTTLTELRKREGAGAANLHSAIDDGYDLLGDIRRHLNLAALEKSALAQQVSFDTLVSAHDDLTTAMTEVCSQLAESNDPAAESLLRRAAEWERAYYNGQAAITVGDTTRTSQQDAAKRPLERPALQDFINSQTRWKGQAVEVEDFRALPGGFGKQTYLCSFIDEVGDRVELVVRKLDPAPIMAHGACRLDNEYALLRALPDSYPAPKPLAYAENWQQVDADFYIVARSPGAVPGAFLGGLSGEVDEQVFLDLARYLGELHSLPLSTFREYAAAYDQPGILDGDTRQAYVKNLEGWQGYVAGEQHLDSPFLVWLMHWLARHIPADERPPVLVHGDFNIHNVLVDQGRISAVLDWECAGFGAAEQDLAYIRPHIAQHIDWQQFLDCYLAAGGRPPREELMAYGMVYAALRTYLAGNKGTLNLQSGRNRDLRYAMVELGFTPSFMNLALANA